MLEAVASLHLTFVSQIDYRFISLVDRINLSSLTIQIDFRSELVVVRTSWHLIAWEASWRVRSWELEQLYQQLAYAFHRTDLAQRTEFYLESKRQLLNLSCVSNPFEALNQAHSACCSRLQFCTRSGPSTIVPVVGPSLHQKEPAPPDQTYRFHLLSQQLP